MMNLEQEFRNFIVTKRLFAARDKVLLAVSGGVDSVVMAELFSKAGYTFSIAHCNFQLREDESEADEDFVESLAERLDVPFYSVRFDTEKTAAKEKLSIQEAARKLRYEWFAALLKEHEYRYVATAHHLNDSIETFLINLLRGTGISGLRGIPAKNQSPPVIRPLLFAKKADLEKFAKQNRLSYRLDHSNETDLYLRNRLRHHLLPLLIRLNPKFEDVMERNMRNLSFAEEMMRVYLGDFLRPGKEKNSFTIDKPGLERSGFPVEMLMELVQPFGFNLSQAENIWNARTGRKVISGNHVLSSDRNRFILETVKQEDDFSATIGARDKELGTGPVPLSLGTKKSSAGKIPAKDSAGRFLLDKSKLSFPLTFRRWKKGDTFFPLGMKGRKKISDFLTDRKVSLPDKEKTYVLLSGEDIVCVLGHRIDERYKVTAQTKEIYQIELKNG